MLRLERGQRQTHRLGDCWITFEGAGGPSYDLTDGQLLARIQSRQPIAIGTRVRVGHYDDAGTWYEIWKILEVDNNGSGTIVEINPAPAA
jgi:hypothetical protein